MEQGLRTVWVVMLREWSATISTPTYWRFVLIMPFVFFLSFLFVRYIGSEDPREQWLTDSRVQDSRLLLESLLLDVEDNGRPRSIQFYAVVDRNGTVSESIRSMISRRDQASFLQALQSMNDVEFSAFLDKIESDESSNQFVRFRELSETNMNSNTLATIESYLIHGTPVEQSEHSLFVEFFSDWWKGNPTIVAETSPLVSTNFFLEVHSTSASEKDIQSLLYQDKIVGYFILPEAQSTRLGKFIFVTSTLTPRVRVLYLVNWYRSVATSAVQDRRMRELGVGGEILDRMTKDVSFQLVDLESPTSVRLRPSDIPTYIYFGLPTLLLLAFLPGAFRLASMIQEEKSNKLTDVLLSSVLPSHLLDGKFWGTTLSSLTAVFVWIVMIGVLVALFSGSNLVQNLSNVSPYLRVPIILNFVLFLVLMYAFYGYLFSAFVSMTNTTQQAMQSVIIASYVILLFVIPSLIIAGTDFFGELLQNVFSLFPPCTPFVMVVRSASLPDWPFYVAIVMVMLVSVFAAREIASRAFALGVIDELRIARFNRTQKTARSVQSI